MEIALRSDGDIANYVHLEVLGAKPQDEVFCGKPPVKGCVDDDGQRVANGRIGVLQRAQHLCRRTSATDIGWQQLGEVGEIGAHRNDARASRGGATRD